MSGATILNKYVIVSALSIAFNPLFWNTVARAEYRSKILTKAFGSPKLGCYALGATIFLLGIFRDFLYKLAIQNSPAYTISTGIPLKGISYVLILLGNVFVLSSMYKLGFVGTYLGDYFGILMSERVTSFPFNVLEHPMYVGSTLSFFGVALYYNSLVGVLLSCFVIVCYMVASKFEGEFTSMIYRQAAEKESKRK